MNRFSKLCALGAALVMSASAFADDLTGYQFPEWNDVEISFSYEGSGSYNWTVDESNSSNIISAQDGTLTATFNLASVGALCFDYGSSNRDKIKVYVDDEEYFNKYDFVNYYNTLTIDLVAGPHTVRWEVSGQDAYEWYKATFTNIGIRCYTGQKLISVTLPDTDLGGGLGAEILSHVQDLKEVEYLKVSGKLNADDFEKLSMMKDNKLFYLDLSEAKFTEIPNEQFKNAKRLNTVILPEGVTKIGTDAFYQSSLASINFPATLTTLGGACFSQTNLREAIMNANCVNFAYIYSYDYPSFFLYCKSLRKIKFPAALTTIGKGYCENCSNLYEIIWPDNLETIEIRAFSDINKLGKETTLSIPEGVTNIGLSAFGSVGYQNLVLPSSYHKVTDSYIFSGSSIRCVRIESPTVLTGGLGQDFLNEISDIDIVVPSFLTNQYKLDKYWYNAKSITGFDASEVTEWNISGDMTLGNSHRLNNAADITINETGSMLVLGDNAQSFGSLTISSDLKNNLYGRFIYDTETAGKTVTVNGDLAVRLNFKAKTWYFISLPFDVKVSNISGSCPKAIRHYDGANRAGNNTGTNWVNYGDNETITAGTGFIFQASEDGWWLFPAESGANKQNLTANSVVSKALEEYPSSEAANKGWNLVGNPYQAWYNIHKIGFSAPITVYNSSNRNYEAYSIIDDDYALAPNQAFFVQCPDGTSEISFPLNGRQLTQDITDQNGVRPRHAKASSRRLVDITLRNEAASDRTRVVLNETASLGYEAETDACKFMSDAAVPQLFTLDEDGIRYAINERAVADGSVSLAMQIPAAGLYTVGIDRNEAGSVMLRDNESDSVIDLSFGEYSFYAFAGSINDRFELMFNNATAINAANASLQNNGIYTVSGIKVGNSVDGLPAGTYIIRSGSKTHKVVIK